MSGLKSSDEYADSANDELNWAGNATDKVAMNYSLRRAAVLAMLGLAAAIRESSQLVPLEQSPVPDTASESAGVSDD